MTQSQAWLLIVVGLILAGLLYILAAGADTVFSGHRDSVFGRPLCGPPGG